MLFINENQSPTLIPEKYNLSIFSSDSSDPRTNIGNPKEGGSCPIETFFESLSLNGLSSFEFDPASIASTALNTWTIGTYIIKPQVNIDTTVQDKYGTTASTNNFVIEIIRDVKANIAAITPSNLILNHNNLVTFKLNLYDTIPFSGNNKPQIVQSFITKPSGVNDPITVLCPNETVKSKNELERTCSFQYTPAEFTSREDAYILTINVKFPDSTSNNKSTEIPAMSTIPVTKSTGIDFIVPAKITTPAENTVIESKNQQIISEIDLNLLPESLQKISFDQFRSLSKYAIQFLAPQSSKEIKPITSISRDTIKVKQIIKDTATKILQFKTNLNFNLSTNYDFTEDFKSLNAFGPAKLYSIISNGNLTNETSDFSQPQKIVILNKPKIQSKVLKEKIDKKTGAISKVLNLTISDNAGGGKAYPLELELEPRDINGSVLNYGRNIQKVYIPKNKLSIELPPIDDLPKETNEVKITLNRGDEFLNEIQGRLDNENFGINILGNITYKHSDTQIAKLDLPGQKETVTYCEVEPENAALGAPYVISYGLKSEKAVSINAQGTRISDNSTNPVLISDIQDKLNSMLDSKHGNIDSSVQDSWNDYSSVTFTLTSGDESDSCNLKIGSGEAFKVGDSDTKTATYGETTITVSRLKDLLHNVGLLSDEQRLEPGYTQAVKNAWKIFIYLTEPCENNNLRLQTTEGNTSSSGQVHQCLISKFYTPSEGTITLPNPDDLPEPKDKNIASIPKWELALDALKTAGVTDVKKWFTPANLALAGIGVAGAVTGQEYIPVSIILFASYGHLNDWAGVKSVLHEIETQYANKPPFWAVIYGFGRVVPSNLLFLQGARGFQLSKEIATNINTLRTKNSSFDAQPEFSFDQLKELNYESSLVGSAQIPEIITNAKKEQLKLYTEGQIKNTEIPDVTTKEKIDKLYSEMQVLTKNDLKQNVIYRNYTKDLSNTPEDPSVIVSDILAPAERHAANSRTGGVEDNYLFREKFVKEDSLWNDRTNFEHLQKQKFFFDKMLPPEIAPTEFYRIVARKPEEVTTLTGEDSGAVFVFWGEGLTKQIVKDKLTYEREPFLKEIGLDPARLQGELTLLVFKNEGKQFTLYKPTNKDANFTPHFRYNSIDEPWGRPLDLNTGIKSTKYKEAVKIEQNISDSSTDPLRSLVEKVSITP